MLWYGMVVRTGFRCDSDALMRPLMPAYIRVGDRCCGHYGQIREFCYTVTSSCMALPHTSPPLIYRFPKCAAASDLFHFSSIHCVYHCYSLQIIVVHHACFV